MSDKEALDLMEVYESRMNACFSTSGRHNNFKKMLDLWQEYPAVRAVWDYVETAFLIVERFVKKTIQKVQELFKLTSNVIYSCEKVNGNQLAYLLRLLDKDGNLIWSKVGTTTRTIEERMREHLRYYRKYDVTTIEVTRVWDCGDTDAEGLESFLRSKYIRKFPGTFQKNDRFYHVEFDVNQADKWVQLYLTD